MWATDGNGGGGSGVDGASLSPLRPVPTHTTTRSLLEVALGFLGAVLIVPLLFKTVSALFKGVFRFGTTRRLVGDVVVAGLSTLLLREDVLDMLFGRKGRKGDGLLKPHVDDDRTDG